MSREALSLEISQVVSRVVSGEPIDTAARGLMLAQKYPELGMSGEMISAAIVRAANMVGMIKSAPMPAAWPDDPAPRAAAAISAAPVNGANGEHAKPPPPVLAQSIEDDLGSEIDAEIGNLLSERAATQPVDGADDQASSETAHANAATRRSGPLAAFRRAFFRP